MEEKMYCVLDKRGNLKEVFPEKEQAEEYIKTLNDNFYIVEGFIEKQD